VTTGAKELTHRVTLQDGADAPQPDGSTARVYSDVKSLWVGMKPLGPRVLFGRMQTDTADSMRFKFRFDPDVRTDRFVLLQSTTQRRRFRINRVEDVAENHEFLLALAEELQEVNP